jgi:biotin transport system substrate-specific component
MPVFYGGKWGFAHILGPTGGYLFGFVLSAWMTGFISERFRHAMIGGMIAVIIGSLAVYCLGVPWLKMMTKMSWNKALVAGMIPFLIGDAIKAAVAIILVRAVRPMLERQMT